MTNAPSASKAHTFSVGIMSSRATQSPPPKPLSPPSAGPPAPDHHYVQASAVPVTTALEGGAVEVDVSW